MPDGRGGLARGDRDGARREWQTALALDPANADVKRSIDGLK